MSYLVDKIEIIERKLLKDDRGYFLKILTGREESLPPYTGEIYLTYAEPGSARGGHYHEKAIEWFTLIQGKAKLRLIDVQTSEYIEYDLDASNPQTIVVPPFVAHIFENHEKAPFLLHAYTDCLYDPNDTTEYKF